MGDIDLDGLVCAWLSGRSVARGLPQPVADRGGYRVDTGGVTEIKRWVFSAVGDGLVAVGREIYAPGYVLKACVTGDELRVMLPDRWQLQASSHLMIATGWPEMPPLASGYTVETVRNGAVVEVGIAAADGDVAARGYGGETKNAFVYDRIETTPAHRRRGLGRSLMVALHDARLDPTTAELLVATDDGRALYETLGWRTICPYATAMIPG